MSVTRAGVIALFLASAALCGGSTGARAQAGTFQFIVCNQSNISASVAVSNLVSATDTRFEVQGWWIVAPGGCETIGTFTQGNFYYFAEETGSPQNNWSGTDLMLCVQNPGPFDRINVAGYNCQTNEQLAGFINKLITSTTSFTWTLTN